MVTSRRRLLATGVTLGAASLGGCLGLGGSSEFDDWAWSGSIPVDSVVQHHDPSCGCCGDYVDYLEANEFDVRVEETGSLESVKRDLGVPPSADSCHTVEFGEYLIEGHVPLEAIEALFDEEPAVLGIAAPGMPPNSPGMGSPGDEPLTVYAFEASGQVYEYVDV